MPNKKTLPKSQYELSTGEVDKRFTRANEVRRDDDKLKELTIGLYDIDYCIKWYFDNVIKPEVNEFGSTLKVPVVHGSAEKWKNTQVDGYEGFHRDKNGKIQSPLISFKRMSITKNKTLSSKVDANFPQIYHSQAIKYNHQNPHDQFSVLTNSKPIKAYITTIIPDFVDVTYDVVIWTDFVEHMNGIVESILYSEGSYWGEPNKFKFRTKIDTFNHQTDLVQDQDRLVRTTFTITIMGYLVSDVLVKNLSKKQSSKVFDTRQLVIDTSVDSDPSVYQQADIAIMGGGVVVNEPTPIQSPTGGSGMDPLLSAYLNTKIAIQATSISIPDTAIFTATFLAAPVGLPPTSIASFIFFISGQYVEPAALESFVDNGDGTCTLTIDVAELGFTLVTADEIVAIGRFT